MKKFFCKALPCLENPFEKEAKPSFMAMFSLRNGEDEGSDEPEEATDILVPYVKIPIRLMKQQSLATTMLKVLAPLVAQLSPAARLLISIPSLLRAAILLILLM